MRNETLPDGGELDQIARDLWHGQPADDRHTDDSRYFDIYKLYVEMADRISQRRASANTFFLSVNTALLSILGLIQKFEGLEPRVWIPPFVLTGLLLCVAWFLILRSYRNLNSAKFKIVGLLERNLPVSPWWAAEWTALGQGKDWRKYMPLSLVETLVPALFALAYVFLMAVR